MNETKTFATIVNVTGKISESIAICKWVHLHIKDLLIILMQLDAMRENKQISLDENEKAKTNSFNLLIPNLEIKPNEIIMPRHKRNI